MDRTEKTSEDIQQSDPPEAKTEEFVQNCDSENDESFVNESADPKSNSLDNTSPDSERISTTKNAGESSGQAPVQEQPLESNQKTGDGVESLTAELTSDDHEKDATDSSDQTNETETVANAADSIATNPVPEQTDIPDEAPENATASQIEESGDEKADGIDIAEAPEEQVGKDDLNEHNQGEADPNHESATEEDTENTGLKAEATDTIDVETAVPMASEAVDQETAETNQAQGSSAEDTESGNPTEPLPSENIEEETAATAPENQSATDDQTPEDDAEENSLQTPDTRISLVKIAVSAVLIIALFSGFFLFDSKSKSKTISKDTQETTMRRPQPAKAEKKRNS